MSWYCEWETDDAGCDFTIFQSDDGWHHLFVARRRLVWDPPFPRPTWERYQGDTKDEMEAWGTRQQEWRAALFEAWELACDNSSQRKPYFLELLDDPARAEAVAAGLSMKFATADDLIGFVEHLEALGFQGPSYGMSGYLEYASKS